MKIEQMYTDCLAEAAYYIESGGEAAIIDPIRETTPYLEKIKARGVKLKYVFETHFHADFVSGHIDLAKKTGAKIIFGPLAETKYEMQNAKDEEVFSVGKLKIKVLHTPGHTPESSCYLLFDENGKEYCLFTGDTLFIGDVGRPDLLDGKMTSAELASLLYDSLNTRIKTLPDHVIVYPAHGAGSSCGKNIRKETWSTLGEHKKTNYALQNMSKESFVEAVTEGLSAPPEYFFKDALINKNGYDNIDEVMKRNLKPLSAEEFKNEVAGGAVILDTRDSDSFEKEFIKGSFNIGLNGQYAIWVGTLIDSNKPLVIVAEEGKEYESILRVARIGFENVSGFLKGGIATWRKAGYPHEKISSVTAQEFANRLKSGTQNVLDVRKASEFETGHVKNAQLLELASFPKSLITLDKNKSYFVHCGAGYRSMIASSFLKANGFENIVNVSGGFGQIKNTSAPIEISADASL